MKTINDLPDIKGKRILLRVDWNVPLTSAGTVTETEAWRITRSLGTVHALMQRGARVVIISHIGRDPQASLKPIHEYLLLQGENHIGFVPSLTSDDIPAIIHDLQEGSAVVLENLRSNSGEETNDPVFAALLAGYADYYVNDAFSVSHRSHASVVGVAALLPAYAGLQFVDELRYLSPMRDPQHPSVVIIGGAKFETKLPVIELFLQKADTVILGGALANTLLAARGYSIGTSLADGLEMVAAFKDNEKLLLPTDVVIERPDGTSETVLIDAIPDNAKIVDLGAQSSRAVGLAIAQARTILWNGPLGWYERGYTASTFAVADAVAQSNATSVVGGGDTVTALFERNALEKISFVSTAGGAMLEYLANGTLPGIEALG